MLSQLVHAACAAGAAGAKWTLSMGPIVVIGATGFYFDKYTAGVMHPLCVS